jgi:putative transposase
VNKQFRKNFYPIPFDRLLDMIRYKAELVRIEYIETEESYTSQTCTFCGAIDKFSRVERGLYVCRHCKDPKAINADVSAAVDIVKKIEPHAFDNVPKSWLLLAPKTLPLPSWSKECTATV